VASNHVYEDRWGEVIDHTDSDFLEIRWYDTTDAMSKDEFQRWLTLFAENEERLRRSCCLIDATNFKMDPANSDGPWREVHIVPRYNAAGVKKFAFHFPAGMPLIGKPPQVEGVAKYLTGYFGRRQDVLDWFAR